jgi:serine/threonine-protein kinase
LPDGTPLGIVHRDVSAGNILVGVDGRSRLADFGVAKVNDQALTRTGEVKGKLSYFAPEQLTASSDRPIDGRADLFSLGVVLHELCFGAPPFADVMAWLQRGAPRRFGSGPLAELIAHALAPTPEERFASAAEFAQALRAVQPPDADAPRRIAALVARLLEGQPACEPALGPLDRVILSAFDHPLTGVTPPPSDTLRGATLPVAAQPLAVEMEGPAGDLATAASPLTAAAALPIAASPLTAAAALSSAASPLTAAAALPAAAFPLTAAAAPPAAPLRAWRRLAAVMGGVLLGLASMAVLAGALGRPPAPVKGARPVDISSGSDRVAADVWAPTELPAAVLAAPGASVPPGGLPLPGRPAGGQHSSKPAASSARTRSAALVFEPANRRGYVSLDTEPWALVFFKDRKLGATPFARMPLPVGHHALWAVARGTGSRHRIEVDVAEGRETRMRVELTDQERKPRRVRIRSR